MLGFLRPTRALVLSAVLASAAFVLSPGLPGLGAGALRPGGGVLLADEPTASEASADALAPAEQDLFDLTNQDRATNGVAPLSFDPTLLDIARERAQQQIPLAHLSHTGVDGQLAFAEMLNTDGLAYTLAGENLARASRGDDQYVHMVENALMASPEHHANIVEPRYTELAIGAASDAAGNTVFAEIYRALP